MSYLFVKLPIVLNVLLSINREKYIEQAINSVLSQDCEFEYEIIIADEYSTDKTHSLRIKIQKEYPDKFLNKYK